MHPLLSSSLYHLRGEHESTHLELKPQDVLVSRTKQGIVNAVWVTHIALNPLLLIREPSRVLINTHETRKRRAGGFLRHAGQVTKQKATFDKVQLRKRSDILVKVWGIRVSRNQQMNLDWLIAHFRFR